MKSGRGPLHQREDVRLFCGIIERTKFADLIKTPDTVEGIEILGVAGGELASFEIATAQIFIAECIRTLPAKKMKTQPATIGPGNALSFAKESDKQKEDEIRIDLRLELEIARKFFGGDSALAVLELERGVERMIQFLNENDKGSNVGIAQSAARVMAFKLIDQPARIVDPDVKLIAGVSKKSACDFVQFAGGSAGQFAEVNGTGSINDAIFEINPDLGVGPFKQPLNLAEEGFVHTSVGRWPSSRLSKRSAS